jgi:hypothetical protein
LAYLFEWRTTTALLIVVTCLWSLRFWLRTPIARRCAAGIMVVLLVVGASVLTRSVLRVPSAIRSGDAYVGRIVHRLADMAPRDPGLVVRAVGRQNLGITSTLVDGLERRGRPVHVDEGLEFEYGPQRTLPARKASTIWVVAEDGWVGSRLRAIRGGRLLFSSSRLDRADEQALQRGQRRLYAQARRAQHPEYAGILDAPWHEFAIRNQRGIDPTLVTRVAHLNQRALDRGRCRCVVVAFDHPDARTRHALARLRATS